MKTVTIITIDDELGALVDLALWRTSTGEPLETIAVPRELFLRLYAAWACARLKELAPSQSKG